MTELTFISSLLAAPDSEPDELGIYYRFEDYLIGHGYTDMTGEYISTSSSVAVRVWKFPVLKTTPCGVVIRDRDGKRRFLNVSWYKRYACPTQALALESFIARKKRQISILTSRAKNAERAIQIAQGKTPK